MFVRDPNIPMKDDVVIVAWKLWESCWEKGWVGSSGNRRRLVEAVRRAWE